MPYRIRSINVLSAAQVGFVFGMIIGILPVLVNVLIIQGFAHFVYGLLSGFNTNIGVPGLEFNLAEKLGLKPAIESLQGFDQFLVYFLLFVMGLIFVGLMMGGLSALSAWIYNHLAPRGSGLSVTLEPIGTAVANAPQHPAASIPLGYFPPPVQVAQPGAANASSRAVPLPQVQTPPALTPAARPATLQAPVSNPVPPLPTASGPRLSLATNPTQVWFISKSPFTIGSEHGSDLYASHLAAQHARVEYEPTANGYILSDLSNGQTWVNDRPVQGRHKLNNNFRVRFGQVDLIFNL
jgi:hypothetical protein